jgi:hypothetical protein
MPTEEFLHSRIRQCEREEGLDLPRVELSDRHNVIPASALSAGARTRIESILAEDFYGQPKAERSFEDRLQENRRAIGEAPSVEGEAVKEKAREVLRSMTGEAEREEAKRKAREIAAAMRGRAPDPETDRRAERMKRALGIS